MGAGPVSSRRDLPCDILTVGKRLLQVSSFVLFVNLSGLFSNHFERDSLSNASKTQEQQKDILSLWSCSFAERIYLMFAVLTS